MKILLDECITKKLKSYLQEFDAFTVYEMDWSGIKNGKLMALCIENNFDILLTIDKNLIYQHKLENYAITIVVLDNLNSKIDEILKLIPNFRLQISTFQKHYYYIIT